MWAFSGADHYDNGSMRWADAYSRQSRPNQDKGMDLNSLIFRLKKLLLKTKIQIVAPSQWMAKCVSDSSLMADWPVEAIPYPIDANTWTPVDKQVARDLLGISERAPVVLVGAMGLGNDSRKGFDLFESAIPIIQNRIPDSQIVVFGALPENADVLQEQGVKFLGLLMDNISLRAAYSAADVFVITSRQDNLPNTGLEAMACGTPVVAFDIGGLSDIVSHLETGYLAEPFKVHDLVAGIAYAISSENQVRLAGKSRQKVEEVFSPAAVSSQYSKIYDKVLSQKTDPKGFAART
jgi:glycosyltransferase involved in cell wall biosynthesis